MLHKCNQLLSVIWLSTTFAHAAGIVSQYTQVNLQSDQPNQAAFQDANLVNAWGIVINPSGTIWIANNGTGTSTTYDLDGKAKSTIVTIPLPAGNTASHASPTGVVFNSTNDFSVTSGTKSSAADFIFATEQGTISGWHKNVDATHAILVVDNSAAGAIYKGLAIGSSKAGVNYIYATNFHAGTVDVFDGTFKPALTGTFIDPKPVKGFAPFGIRNLNGFIYVTYAMQDDMKHDDVKGKGHGYINIFDSSGTFVRRFTSKGKLNSPWGMDLACSNFGSFNGALLVGNFGDGTITAFDFNGKTLGQLESSAKTPIVIDGLWGLTFGLGCSGGERNTLYFTAGPNDEAHGLFGMITLNQP